MLLWDKFNLTCSNIVIFFICVTMSYWKQLMKNQYRTGLCMILKSKAFRISVEFSHLSNHGETHNTSFGRTVRVILLQMLSWLYISRRRGRQSISSISAPYFSYRRLMFHNRYPLDLVSWHHYHCHQPAIPCFMDFCILVNDNKNDRMKLIWKQDIAPQVSASFDIAATLLLGEWPWLALPKVFHHFRPLPATDFRHLYWLAAVIN